MDDALEVSRINPAPMSRAVIMAESLVEEGQQRKLLMAYVQNHMIEGTDFGVIPGTKNKTLLKPGAEKLVELFRCRADYEQIRVIEDWEKPLFHYEFSCKIVLRGTDMVVAQGVGSCNSREAKYRWRPASRVCPHCGKETIIKGKADFGGGWLCFGKKGGCGAKFADGDQSIEGQATGRVENPDVFDCVNTILKMAKKRALVDASIALARCSDMFTQDAEDIQETSPRPPVQVEAEIVDEEEPREPLDKQLVEDLARNFKSARGHTEVMTAIQMVKANEKSLTEGGKAHLKKIAQKALANHPAPQQQRPADPAPAPASQPAPQEPAGNPEPEPEPEPDEPLPDQAEYGEPVGEAPAQPQPQTQKVSGDRVQTILQQLHTLDMSWPQARGEFGKLIGLNMESQTRVGDLTAAQADNLEAVLKPRIEAKQKRARKPSEA